MNWVSVIVVGIFTIDMVIKTWICAFRPEWYNQYVLRLNNEVATDDIRSTHSSVNNVELGN